MVSYRVDIISYAKGSSTPNSEKLIYSKEYLLNQSILFMEDGLTWGLSCPSILLGLGETKDETREERKRTTTRK